MILCIIMFYDYFLIHLIPDVARICSDYTGTIIDKEVGIRGGSIRHSKHYQSWDSFRSGSHAIATIAGYGWLSDSRELMHDSPNDPSLPLNPILQFRIYWFVDTIYSTYINICICPSEEEKVLQYLLKHKHKLLDSVKVILKNIGY